MGFRTVLPGPAFAIAARGPRARLPLAVLGLWLAVRGMGADAPTPEIAFTVRLDRPMGVASPLLYGCSLPAPGTPGASVLSPELLRNGSFEATASGKPLPLPAEWGERPGWELRSCGSRRIVVHNRQGEECPLILVGNRLWKDYRISLLARKLDGPGGLCILFEVEDDQNHLRWTLGGLGNRYHILESVGRGTPRELAPPVVGRIEVGRCYRIDISLREGVLRCSLDGRLIHRLGEARFRSAGVGLGATDATAEYFDLTARARNERPLYLLDDPTEARRDSISGGWEPLSAPGNAVTYYWEFVYPQHGQFSQRIRVEKYLWGEAGLRQRGIPLSSGVAYRGRIHLRGPDKPALQISLRSRDGKVHASHEVKDIPEAWTPYDFTFTPAASDPAADFCLTVNRTATVWVDGVSLVRGDAPAALGLRREAAEALRTLRPTVLRWPAGPGVAHFNWERSIGPRDRRPVVPEPAAKEAFEFAPSDFGTDEFLALSKELGAEPICVVNPSLGLGPALDWIEYCNGAAATPMGKLRAANGRAEPYGVKLWEVADPAPQADARQYGDTVAKFARKMREQDPSLRLLARGRPFGSSSSEADGALLAKVLPAIDYVAKDGRITAGRAAGGCRIEDLARGVASLRGRKGNLALADWAPVAREPDRVPTAAAVLSLLAREGGPEAIAACPCFDWWPASLSIEGLFAGPRGSVKPTPTCETLRLLRSHAIRDVLQVEGEGSGPDLDVVAGRDGDRVVVRIAHFGDKGLRASVVLDGLGSRHLAAEAEHVRIRNPEKADSARTETERIAVAGTRLTVSLLPRSLHVLVLRLEGT